MKKVVVIILMVVVACAGMMVDAGGKNDNGQPPKTGGFPAFKYTDISKSVDSTCPDQGMKITVSYNYYMTSFNKVNSTGKVYIRLTEPSLITEAVDFVKTYFSQMGATGWKPITGKFNREKTQRMSDDDITFANGSSLASVLEQWVKQHVKVKALDTAEKDKGSTKYGKIKGN